jgi:hypothetical protein
VDCTILEFTAGSLKNLFAIMSIIKPPVVRVSNVPLRALRRRKGRNDRVLQGTPCAGRCHMGSVHG